MNKSFPLSAALLFLFLWLLLPGCAPPRPQTDPEMDRKALELLSKARALNHEVLTSKGTGWVTLETSNESTRHKIAWAAVHPNKIRLTFLMFGQPIETIVSTGETVTFVSHTGQHIRYSINSRDPDMEKYINVPIKLSQIIAILLGRLPITDHGDAYFLPSDPGLSRIILYQKKNGPVQQLSFDDDEQIESIKGVDAQLNTLYEYRVLKHTPHDSGMIPSAIRIIDSQNRKVTVTLSQFKPNPSIKESVFVLTENG